MTKQKPKITSIMFLLVFYRDYHLSCSENHNFKILIHKDTYHFLK